MPRSQLSLQWQLFPGVEFTQYRHDWDQLNARISASALLSSRFIQPCLDHFSDEQLMLAVAREGERIVAMTLIERVGYARWLTFQPSQAPVGCWLSDLDYDLDRLLESLAKALPDPALQISITQQDPQIMPRPEQNPRMSTLDYITTGRLDIPDDFEAYWQNRGKNVRQNTNKAKNRLEREGVDIRLEIAADEQSVRDYVAEFGVLESAGWKRETGTAVHIDNQQGRFYTQLLQSFMPENCQVWRYYFNDQLVAIDLCLCVDGVLYILKTTYDEQWKRYSPAFMMHLEGVRELSQLPVERIEFYGPAMDWHKKLTQDLRTMYHITWYRSALLPKLKQLLRRSKGSA
ncbi:GNAT family N-acetyltransferase [Motiliproteus sp.]|uniref:GNAT family N-acetyltransferase n=1 Tax=Motiliproteus sp. TaxID=1898955 RepID=UPI003BA99537